jgi:hypothetical protein
VVDCGYYYLYEFCREFWNFSVSASQSSVFLTTLSETCQTTMANEKSPDRMVIVWLCGGVVPRSSDIGSLDAVIVLHNNGSCWHCCVQSS